MISWRLLGKSLMTYTNIKAAINFNTISYGYWFLSEIPHENIATPHNMRV